MKHKKLKLTALALFSVVTLAGCGDSELVSMKGGKITEDQFFQELKENPQSSEILSSMIVKQITTKNYSKDVDEKEVDKQYKDYEDQYGGKKAFEEVLKQNGMDAKQFKDSLKEGLAFQAMLKAHTKISDEDIKETWATFHPKVETQIMVFPTKEDADKALKKVNDGEDFGKVAKEDSTDEATKADNGKVIFDSTMQTEPINVLVPQDVKEAAYKLEDGKVSDVIASQNMQTGMESFYIVKMVKNQQKGNDYKPFEKELKKIAEENKAQDPMFQQEVLGKELEDANVKIKDDQYKDILAPYLPQKEEKTDDSKKDDAKDDKKDDAKKDDSKKDDDKKDDKTDDSKKDDAKK